MQPWHWFVLAAAVPVAHCASRLNLDLWHDEIYTIDVFVRRGPAFIVSDYSLPNNHVLFSLLMWPFYCLSDSNFVLRLPSFLLTIGTLAMLFRLAYRLCGLPCAVLSTALLGLNQMYLNFAIQVRGYSLSMFLTAWLACLAVCESNGSSRWRRLIAVTFVGAGLLYTMPSNALFFLPLAAVALGRTILRRRTIKDAATEAVAWGLAMLLAVVLYLPILSQIRSTAQASSPSSWSYLPVIAGNYFRPATHDFVWFAPFVLLGLLAWAWPQPEGQKREWTVPALCGGVVVGALLLTGLLRISPFERIYCPLLVFLCLAGGWLLAELTEVVRNHLARIASEAAVGAALAAVSLTIWPQLWTYPQRLEARRNEINVTEKFPIADGYYCYYVANYHPSTIVDYLLDRRIEQSAYRLCWTEVDHLNLWYYFAKAGLPQFHAGSTDAEDRTAWTFAIVPEPPPWKNLAADCGLTADEIDAFRLVGDFGYYRLYQSDSE